MCPVRSVTYVSGRSAEILNNLQKLFPLLSRVRPQFEQVTTSPTSSLAPETLIELRPNSCNSKTESGSAS